MDENSFNYMFLLMVFFLDCNFDVHRLNCVRLVEENCPGPMAKKESGISKLMEKIQSRGEGRRKPSALNFSQGKFISVYSELQCCFVSPPCCS